MPVKYGVSLDNTILENLAILPTFANLYIDLGKIGDLDRKLIDEYKIMAPSPAIPVKILSGGNI